MVLLLYELEQIVILAKVYAVNYFVFEIQKHDTDFAIKFRCCLL